MPSPLISLRNATVRLGHDPLFSALSVGPPMPIASAWSGATAPVTSVIALGGGRLQEYAGGYSDMLRQRGAAPATAAKQHPLRGPPHEGKIGSAAMRAPSSTQREPERLIDRIEVLMEEIRRLEGELADPDLFRRDPEAFAACTDRLARAQPIGKEPRSAGWVSLPTGSRSSEASYAAPAGGNLENIPGPGAYMTNSSYFRQAPVMSPR